MDISTLARLEHSSIPPIHRLLLPSTSSSSPAPIHFNYHGKYTQRDLALHKAHTRFDSASTTNLSLKYILRFT